MNYIIIFLNSFKKCCSTVFFFLTENFFNVYLFLRESDSVSRGRAERDGDAESKAGARLCAVSTEPDLGLEPINYEIMT